MDEKIVLGTRGSELARAQAALVETAIREARPRLEVEIKVITTKGDQEGRSQIRDLHRGRKGLFTAELERALLAGDLDVAVHSAKDLPSEISPGAEIAAALPRALTDDVLVSRHRDGLAALKEGATIATGSVRRKHQLSWTRPDLKIIDLQGNVPTRLRKLAENDWDAVVLAHAGLERLGLSVTQGEINVQTQKFFLEVLRREIFLSAGGQGIIAMQIRADAERARTTVDLVNNRETLLCLRAEREFLRLLHGDCNSPVGVLATMKDGVMKLRGQLFDQNWGAPREGEVEGAFEDGERLAAHLLRQVTRK